MDTSSLYREIGSLIRRRRRGLDLTQAELAASLGISRGALANVETGRQAILVHQLYRFAAVLGINVHDLLPIPNELTVKDLLPIDKGILEAQQQDALPMPKGLSLEQKAQVTRVFTASLNGRSRTE